MCINIYDVRLSDTSPDCGMNWPPTLRPTYDYLARADVRKALHVNEQAKPEAWIECNHRVSSALRDERNPQSSKIHIPELLDRGVKVLLFAGDQDLICNHIGVERVPRNLHWSGASSWEVRRRASACSSLTDVPRRATRSRKTGSSTTPSPVTGARQRTSHTCPSPARRTWSASTSRCSRTT